MKFLIAIMAMTLGIPFALMAHGGGIDSQGGHHDRKRGGYHFHRGPLADKGFASKAAGTSALRRHKAAAKDSTLPTKGPQEVNQESKRQCGTKRTCKQMASCSEARFYLEQCGLSRLDGDKDGTPCESLCR